MITRRPSAIATALAAAWDLACRAWLVVAAWYGLRRPTPLRWLASIPDPQRFLRAAVVPAGRHFALALAFLPRARREEATVAFLVCKALDAFEDLSADRQAARDGLAAAADFLTGRTERPPSGDGMTATRDSDRLEALLAARLPLLRAALEALPDAAVVRCRALIDQIAAGMQRAHVNRRRYADDVLGEAVVYAAEVAAPGLPPPRIACRATGRALQLANDLRDAETARGREIALYRALPELPIVPRLLRWLPAGVGPGTRAAATLVAVTTCAFYLRHIAQPVARPIPRCLRHPLRTALAAACSPRAYLATVAAIEGVLRHAVAGATGLAADPAGSAEHVGLAELPLTAPVLDTTLPAGTSDPVASAAPLVALAMELVHAVPVARLDAATSEQPGKAIVLADYLLFAAVVRVADAIPGSISHVAALLERLAGPADRAALSRSTALARLAEEIGHTAAESVAEEVG